MATDWQDKQVVIVGAGSSGQAAAVYLARAGARVVLSDRRPAEALDLNRDLAEAGVDLDLGRHDPEGLLRAELVVVSPGVPQDAPFLLPAREAGIPVIGEVELAAVQIEAPLMAVSGTNGKSTTTVLLGEILRAWGRRTFVGGNLGTPLIEAADGSWDWVVAEVSSFQLETIRSFRPRYALLLNISEDHLDRYPDMPAYVGAKARLFENQQPGDIRVLNADDPLVAKAAAAGLALAVGFSTRRPLAEGMSLDGEEILWRWRGEERRFAVKELRLRGLHNVENVMAALIPPLVEGCPAAVAWEAVCRFGGLEHRMAPVRTLDGVVWYDDSKGTNVGSVVKSLAGLEAPVTLIAGGRDKGGDYGLLAEAVREKVAHLLLLGEAAPRMEAVLGHLTRTLRVGSLEEAVRTARRLTPPGGVVLLSPGCSSFDMFRDYRQRGEVFARAVRDLPEQEAV